MGKDWRDRLRPQPTPSLTNTLDYLPTAAPTSQYLDTSKVAVAWVSMGGILYTIIWLIVYFIRRIRYPTKLYERIKNKNELPDGEEVFLHHSLASYEEVKENPIDYYVLDPSGDSSIMVPLKPDAYVSPYRAYVKLPQGRLSRANTPRATPRIDATADTEITPLRSAVKKLSDEDTNRTSLSPSPSSSYSQGLQQLEQNTQTPKRGPTVGFSPSTKMPPGSSMKLSIGLPQNITVEDKQSENGPVKNMTYVTSPTPPAKSSSNTTDGATNGAGTNTNTNTNINTTATTNTGGGGNEV